MDGTETRDWKLATGFLSTLYSVVTDLARLRGKSTSTPFITARSTL